MTNDLTPPVYLFALRRYDIAVQRFVWDAVHALMRSKDPVLGMTRTETVASLPTSRVSLAPDVVVDRPPITVEGDISFPVQDVIDGTFGALYVTINSAADQGLETLMPALFQHISDVTTAAGHVIDAKGAGISHDLILDALESMEVAFDEFDQPRMPSMIVSPEMARKLHRLPLPTEAQMRRHREIMEQKLAAHLARKRSRRLP